MSGSGWNTINETLAATIKIVQELEAERNRLREINGELVKEMANLIYLAEWQTPIPEKWEVPVERARTALARAANLSS